MKLVNFNDPKQFERIAVPALQRYEDVYSLMLGVLADVQTGRYKNVFQAIVEENGKVVALLQMTLPHPLNIIILDEERANTIAEAIVPMLVELDLHIPAVVGMKQWTIPFAKKWSLATRKKFSVKMDEGIYRLDEVTPGLPSSPGNMRIANETDRPLIEEWFSEFEHDAGLVVTPRSVVQDKVAQFVQAKEVFLWENHGQVVSMMKKSRPTEHGVTVSLVFTPREERRKGYGRTLVAAASAELLKEYNFCVLYTHLANSTSNKIYKEIGYRQIANSVHLAFDDC